LGYPGGGTRGLSLPPQHGAGQPWLFGGWEGGQSGASTAEGKGNRRARGWGNKERVFDKKKTRGRGGTRGIKKTAYGAKGWKKRGKVNKPARAFGEDRGEGQSEGGGGGAQHGKRVMPRPNVAAGGGERQSSRQGN